VEYKFLFSYVLILIALYYSYKEKLGIEKQILINSIRAFIQLLILGYLLVYIFKIKNPFFISLILVLMVLFAAYTAQGRIKIKNNGILTSFICIFLSSLLVIVSLILIGVISFKPNEIIPVGGMVIGNSLNIYALTVDRLKGEIKNNIQLIENFISLGASLKYALYNLKKVSVKAALIPTLNNLQTVGIIHIPGITTGMLLAGAPPLKAISYQLVIMYMMVAVALFTSIITINFAYKKIFETATTED
jgi:putative ABC transport system permease protein